MSKKIGAWATRASKRAARRSRETRGPDKGHLNNGAAALMREANEIGSEARARQERTVRQSKAPFSNLQLTRL